MVPPRENSSNDPSADRNLLFGVLAWQAGVLTESKLLAAMQAWTFSKSKSLGEILVEQTVLIESQREELDQMVTFHLRLHRNDAAQALQSLSSVPAVANSLRQQISDDDVQASLNHFGQTVIADSAGRGVVSPGSAIVKSVSSGDSRFHIIRPHARGGLGEVFVAKDQELNREVALKEIQPQFADHSDSRSRFVQEAELTGRLEHPNIVPVYGLGQYEDGRPYYAMRFIAGDSLKDAIKQFHENKTLTASERTLQLRKLLGRFVDVCQAISYAHSRGVLHRDLKPGNIMLGKYGETLVVDWGLAKVTGRHETTPTTDEQTLQLTSESGVTPTVVGGTIGTPAYMPPEQACGKLDELGPMSDVYSLGATLYCLLTGQAPFTGTDAAAVLDKVQQGNFRRPSEFDPGIPRMLESICVRAMSLQPHDRYQSVDAMTDDVERYLALGDLIKELTYTLTEEEYLESAEWKQINSRTLRKQARVETSVRPMILFCLGVLLLVVDWRSMMPWALLLFATSIMAIVTAPIIRRRKRRGVLRRMLAEDGNRRLQEVRVVLTPHNMAEYGKTSFRGWNWSDVRFEVTESLLLFSVSITSNMMIIPKRAFPNDEECQAFVAEVERCRNDAGRSTTKVC